MVNVKDVANFMKGYKINNAKTPILKWDKKANQNEIERYRQPRVDLYFNMETTKIGYELEDILTAEQIANQDYAIFTKTSQDEIHYYMEYIEELDIIIVGRAKLDCHAVRKENSSIPRKWERYGEIIITRDRRIFYENWSGYYTTGSDGRYYWNYNSDGVLKEKPKFDQYRPFSIDKIPNEDAGLNHESYQEIAKVLLNIFPQFCNVGANRVYDILSSSFMFNDFLKYKEPIKRNGPKQKKIDGLVSKPLNEIPYKEEYSNKMAFIEKVEDGLCVLRTMIKDSTNKMMVDAARIYVGKKEIIACRPTNNGEWINMTLNSNGYNWDFELSEFDKDIVKGTRLEYFSSIVDDVDKKYQGHFICAMLQYPIIEQLSKLGLAEYLIKDISSHIYEKAIVSIEKNFGKVDLSKKSLYSQLGINKYQLNKIIDMMNSGEYEGWEWLCYIKCIFNNQNNNRYYYYSCKNSEYTDISSIDNKTFDAILKALIATRDQAKDGYKDGNISKQEALAKFTTALKKLRIAYSIKTMNTMIDDIVYISNKRLSMENSPVGYIPHWRSYGDSAAELYCDYLDMVQKLDDSAHFKARFNREDLESIRNMHDAAVTVYNLKADEIKAENFNRIIKEWDKWLYDDDDYAVIAPQSPNDIANEGITLHHCVKSYIDKVIARTTNILFIRKKEALDTPFFTVEVTNDGAIQQIHGACNRNLNTEPDLEPFVKDWIKKKKMKSKNFNKVR